MTRTVQEEVRPRLTRVEDRGQQLKSLGPAANQLTPGSAVAVLGAPGVALHRLAADVLRGIPDSTLIVWLDLVDLSRAIGPSTPEGIDPTVPGGVWDQALDTALRSVFEQVLLAEGVRVEEVTAALDVSAQTEDPGVERIERFANVSRRLRRWPVIVVESMHRLPWPVSERLQWTLRKALDNSDRAPLLRLVLTGCSDFLSGEAIAGGGGFSTSPLYTRTGRYEVLPFTLDQLYELSPMPGGLADRLLEVLMIVTGGSIGLFEVAFAAIAADPSLGQALLDAIPEGGTEAPPWLWDWICRADGLKGAAHQLMREGLGALLSSPKGRSWQIVEGLEALLNGQVVEEASADALLPLELAGLAVAEKTNGHYRYRFVSPLVPPLLRQVLPGGRRLRDQLEVFSRDFTWEPPAAEAPLAEPASVRVTGGGTRLHFTAPVPLTGAVATPAEPPRRTPLDLPPYVIAIVADPSPAAARVLIELLRDIGLAAEQARKDRNSAILTFAQLDIRRISYAGSGLLDSGSAATAVSGSTPDGGTNPGVPVPTLFSPGTPQLTGTSLLGRWEVRMLPQSDDNAQVLEAAALFLPPERLTEWLHAQGGKPAFVPNSCDDAFALGLMAGLLLGREPDPRLIIEKIERRLTASQELGIGAMLRLIRSCLDPVARRRPTLDDIIARLNEVLADPYRTPRNIVRVLSVGLMVAVVALGLFDFALDTRVSNPNWLYTGVKLVGAGAWAAFYVAAWFVLGRTNREQINEQLSAFLRQRLNRIRWMAFPAALALGFSILFLYRLDNAWGVQLSLDRGQKLVEIEERIDGDEVCRTAHKFAEPVGGALVRLRLDDREYVFIVDEDAPGGGTTRKQYHWPMEKATAQRLRGWGDSLYVYALSAPPAGKGCLPDPAPSSPPLGPIAPNP